MSIFISFRDITFTPSLTGVRIVAITDVASHLFCRLTSEEPRIHKKTSIIRGLSLKDDVRFCFTVFEDNEQFEAGDTFTHTWWKTSWPVCTTKYLYLWGTIAGATAVSTSPFFKYHNTGESPVPPPDTMYQLNAIDPQYYEFNSGGAWHLADLSRDIPEGATGAVIQFYNLYASAESNFALRKPGCTYQNFQPFQRDGMLWAIVGLDTARRFEYFFQRANYLRGYLMGYTGRDVVFPDTPINIKPTVDNAYQVKDIKTTWPNAILILTDMGSQDAWNMYHSIRPQGSAKEVYQGSYRKFPFCAIPPSGNIETKLNQSGHVSSQWLAYAYFKQDTSYSLNGVDLGSFSSGVWKDVNCGTLSTSSRWAFIEYYLPGVAINVGVRKNYSYFNYVSRCAGHGWLITHLHHDLKAEVYASAYTLPSTCLHLAETH